MDFHPGNISRMDQGQTYTVFAGERRLFRGDLREMLAHTKAFLDEHDERAVLIFDDESGRQVEFDFSGTLDEVLAREAPAPRTGPGRPKLGVVSREVSLLPRHWEWLEREPNGISAALRRLVEEAMKRDPERQRARRARDATGRVMTSLAGDLPGFEEAMRALYAADAAGFRRLLKKWPTDVQKHLLQLSQPAFGEGERRA